MINDPISHFSLLLQLFRFWKTELPFDESERTLAGLKSLTIGETRIEEDTLLNAESVDGPEVCDNIILFSLFVTAFHLSQINDRGIYLFNINAYKLLVFFLFYFTFNPTSTSPKLFYLIPIGEVHKESQGKLKYLTFRHQARMYQWSRS